MATLIVRPGYQHRASSAGAVSLGGSSLEIDFRNPEKIGRKIDSGN